MCQVAASIVELFLAPPSFISSIRIFLDTKSSGFSGLTALRTFRVFRLLKLARSWKSLQQILATIVRSLKSGLYFLLLLVLFILIYALVGMQFFANRLHFDATTHDPITFKNIPPRYAAIIGVAGSFNSTLELEYAVREIDATIHTPRTNFDTLSHAVFSVVQVLSVRKIVFTNKQTNTHTHTHTHERTLHSLCSFVSSLFSLSFFLLYLRFTANLLVIIGRKLECTSLRLLESNRPLHSMCISFLPHLHR